jgi:radical SAM enzyme (TIGR01210 family)
MTVTSTYPSGRAGRDRFVLERRPLRPQRDPLRHQGVLVEDERAADGTIARVATIFLTGRECPWRCVMCDLWRHTIADDTPAGALPEQLDDALAALQVPGSRPGHVKLYNASNFFDPRAVPEGDYDAIAARLTSFRHVIVESHPALVGKRLVRFVAALARAAAGTEPPTLEVAIGLETAHSDVLRALNKGFTLEQFARAAERLRQERATLRAFVLVGVPFVAPAEQQEWTARSVSFAFDCGASVVSLIPTRPGNGALEALGATPPDLTDLEAVFEHALPNAAARLFADLWDLERFSRCCSCFGARQRRLHRMNLEQRVHPPVVCHDCGTTSGQAA